MYLTRRFYILLAVGAIVTGLGFLFLPIYYVGCLIVAVLAMLVVIDIFRLYAFGHLNGSRTVANRLSNGDENLVTITVSSSYHFKIHLKLIDELPWQFQKRDMRQETSIAAGESTDLTYILSPTDRGEYEFGLIRLFASTRIGLVQRRFSCGEPKIVKVYPSFLQLNNIEISFFRNDDNVYGMKKTRRAGNDTDFSQIRDYNPDDEYRHINWKASARRHQLMVNIYEEEKSQHIYNIIDKGRVMQQSYRGITLLDHSINAALALTHIALLKNDNIGLATFDNNPGTFIQASHNRTQRQLILESLYNISTDFDESNFRRLGEHINSHIHKRSLLVLYTNFFSANALRRQLPFFQQISQRHRLLIVFFEDHEQNDYILERMERAEDYYRHVVAEKNSAERRSLITLLGQQGIMALLTDPRHLTADVLNKYIEIKSRNMI